MIDVSKWGEFRIGDLFSVSRPSSRSSKNYDEGDMPFVASGNFNNGVTAYLQPKDETDYDEGNCITVSAVDGYAFYQKDKFLGRGGAGSSIMMLRNANLTEMNGKYICTLIRKACSDWEYSNMGNKDKLADTIIWLPVTSINEPDWSYMESYMKTVIADSRKSLENLKKANGTKHPINVSEWGEFRIADLFDMSLPKGDLQVKKVDDGDVPLITPSNFNNGMLQRISEHSPSTLYNKGSLTVDMFGNAYYQEEDFFVTAHGHVNVLLPKIVLNEYTGTFLASAIRAMFLDKYGFSEMCTLKVLKVESIKLPVTSAGVPDWQYMDNYMQEQFKKSELAITKLQSGLYS